jgi:hypothetical protein
MLHLRAGFEMILARDRRDVLCNAVPATECRQRLV